MKKIVLLLFLGLLSCQSTTQVPVLNEKYIGEKYGCADFRIYRANENGNNILEVTSDGIHQGDTSYLVDVATNKMVKIRIIRFDQVNVIKQVFCNDVGVNIKALDTINAVAGSLTIEVTKFKKGTVYNNFMVNVKGSDI